MIDSGQRDIAKISAMSKLYSSRVAVSVTTQAISILGSDGISENHPIEKFFRDAKITQIYEGTSEIQSDVIARHLIKEAASKK
jgi:alkylation response protein AidB-like acyl-CoA dehydrogenase